jgi:hypothetical protein
MTIRASLQTSMRLAALLVAAAIVLATPYGVAAAVRSGTFCVVTVKAAGRTPEAGVAGVYASRRTAVRAFAGLSFPSTPSVSVTIWPSATKSTLRGDV